jgi:hypothetical protein
MIDGVIVAMKKQFHDDVLSGDVHAQFGVLCRADPKTGRPLDKPGLVLVIPTSLDTEGEKDSLAMTLRMIVVAGEAVATLVCMDTWVALGADAEDAVKRGIAPSDHPNRREAMFVGIERADGQNVAEYHAYTRLDDDVVFEDSERKMGMNMGGRFGGLLPPRPPPPEAVTMMRQLIAMGAAGELRMVER